MFRNSDVSELWLWLALRHRSVTIYGIRIAQCGRLWLALRHRSVTMAVGIAVHQHRGCGLHSGTDQLQ